MGSMTVAWTWRLDILRSFAGFPMSKQSKNRSSSTTPEGTTSRQPKLLGVMVLVGGAISTWCWYRPLPKDAKNVANGLVSVASAGDMASKEDAPPKSLWGLEGLVFPSFFSKASPDKNDRGGAGTNVVAVGSGAGDLPGDLVGDQELQLTPYQRLDTPLKDRVAGEPLPIIPVMPPLHRGPPAKPPLWVDGDDLSGNRSDLIASQPIDASLPISQLATNTADLDAPSPFRIPPRSATNLAVTNLTATNPAATAAAPAPFLAESKKWPDEGFHPSQGGTLFRSDRGQLASGNQSRTEGATSISGHGRDPLVKMAAPGFIANSNSAERDRVMAFSSNRIRTKEVEELEPPRDNRLAPATGSAPPQVRVPDPSNVIRQPRTSSDSKL